MHILQIMIHKLVTNLDRLQHHNNNTENDNNENSSSSPADNIYMSSLDDYMDDDSNSSSEDHHHRAIDNNENDDDDDEELGKTCPTFTSKGKFIHYEFRAEGKKKNTLIQEEVTVHTTNNYWYHRQLYIHDSGREHE